MIFSVCRILKDPISTKKSYAMANVSTTAYRSHKLEYIQSWGRLEHWSIWISLWNFPLWSQVHLNRYSKYRDVLDQIPRQLYTSYHKTEYIPTPTATTLLNPHNTTKIPSIKVTERKTPILEKTINTYAIHSRNKP